MLDAHAERQPLAKSKIRGDEDRGSLVEPADEVKEKLAAGLGEGEISEFVEDDEVHAGQIVGDRPWRPARGSASRRLARSTVVNKRPRDPARMQLRAMAIAKCVLPVPVPRYTLRCAAGR